MSKLMRKLKVVSEVDESTLLKVAFASSDRMHVDQHFGSALALVVYGVNPEVSVLLDVCEFAETAMDSNGDKLALKLDSLTDCIAVYCRACGSSGVKQLINRGIRPVKVQEGAEIAELVSALQEELRDGPSSWLARAVAQKGMGLSRFDSMDMESWDE